jgi:hypothetical protein
MEWNGGGGPSRNRTGVQGFAVLCVTTPPSGPGVLAPFRDLWRGVKPDACRRLGKGPFTVQAPQFAHLSMNDGWRGGKLPI